MSPAQRGYLRGGLCESIAEGIDLLLIHCGRRPWGWSASTVYDRLKESYGVDSVERLSHQDCCDYITHVQAFMGECLIFVPDPDEYRTGRDWQARQNHYEYVLGEDQRFEVAA